MKMFSKVLAAFVIGTVLGLCLTWFAVVRGSMPGGVSDGPWKTNLLIGNTGGDMATRASVAVHGLLALNRSETVYYTTGTDSAGNKLDGACTYRIAGRDPATRWWSITAYAADDYLIPNPAHRYSVSKTSVVHEADGTFIATVSPKPAPQNWIATVGARYSLTLRLYNPDPAVVRDPAHATLPSIVKERCP
jgi:hypothetical protein